MPEPPYRIIVDRLKQGTVIPFLGAGASLSGRPPNAKWDDAAPTFLPSASELAHQLADDSSLPSTESFDRDDLSKVSSYYAEVAANRADLRESLHHALDRDYQIGAIHRFLAEIDVPLLIVTTNYDDLIERAFRAKGKPYHLVAYPTDHKELAAAVLWWKPGVVEPEAHAPKSLPLSLTDTTIIYKMHGTVDRQTSKWDSYVITEEDYVDFLARMTGQTAIPARFMLEFRKRRFLFIGYGLRDWNLRVMLRHLKSALVATDTSVVPSTEESEDLRSWAIQRNPSELERALWLARKVNIYDKNIDEFVAELLKKM
ncbi:MAG: SIR2 family protein [Chloroflexi bacterium]|nr:SIR2 family protein [Chloroflexota bacterium]